MRFDIELIRDIFYLLLYVRSQLRNIIDAMIEICDQHGQKVSDPDKQLCNKVESFANLQSFKSAMRGNLGSIIETITGTKMYVAYETSVVTRNPCNNCLTPTLFIIVHGSTFPFSMP